MCVCEGEGSRGLFRRSDPGLSHITDTKVTEQLRKHITVQVLKIEMTNGRKEAVID